MSDEMQTARKHAEKLRFSGDTPWRHGEKATGNLSEVRSHFSQNGLCISHEVTPALHERLRNVYERLHIPETVVEAFVYASPEIQAACVSSGSGECVIRFTSALVETMSLDEFEFVAGHELGHFLLEHGIANAQNKQESLEHFMRMRSQEISADRTGLIACNSLDVAIRAMMKILSGLTSQHLRFDVGTFISQIKKRPSHADEKSSHPSMLVRCRALLWFSMSGYLYSAKTPSQDVLVKLDKRIEKDFHNYVDGPVRKIIERAKDNLSIWLAAYEIVQDNTFSKHEQKRFSEIFGEKTLASLKNFLKSIPGKQIHSAIESKILSARKEIGALIPADSAKEIARIEKRVQDQLS